MAMRRVAIGKSRILSSALGLGCMGMSEFYGPATTRNRLKTLERALELGVSMFDTSNVYGRGHNEELVGRFLAGKRDRAIVSTKFGVVRDPNGPSGSTYDRGIDNSAAYMRQCCDNSLKRLRTDYIDLYYVHRLDPDVDVEDVIGPMADLVKEGKIRAIGLSEVSSDILRRANAVHPISALQSEYSLWFRDPEADVILHAVNSALHSSLQPPRPRLPYRRNQGPDETRWERPAAQLTSLPR
jgi:aryl-alcohol dehydrogenase-like predicted oxidoreductase